MLKTYRLTHPLRGYRLVPVVLNGKAIEFVNAVYRTENEDEQREIEKCVDFGTKISLEHFQVPVEKPETKIVEGIEIEAPEPKTEIPPIEPIAEKKPKPRGRKPGVRMARGMFSSQNVRTSEENENTEESK